MLQTDQQARDLAKQIVTESSARIKIGKVNGRRCLHVKFPSLKDQTRASFTIFSDTEWYPLRERLA